MSEATPRCPCCNNPWSFSDQCNTCMPVSTPLLNHSNGGIDLNNFDQSVSPKENFYLHSNGGWMASNPIPAEYSSWNTFMALRDTNLERLKGIMESLQSLDSDVTEDQRKLADFFNAMMDESAVELAGISPIREVLDMCDNVKETNIETIVGTLHAKYDVKAFFSVYSSPDKTRSAWTIATLSQNGLGLPDRDYYFDADKKEKLEKYALYVERVFSLLGRYGVSSYPDEQACKAAAADVVMIEKELAAAHLTRTERRDPELTYNKMSIESLSQISQQQELSWPIYLARGPPPAFQWNIYFNSIGRSSEELGDINISSVAAVKKAVRILKSARYYANFGICNATPIENYLKYHTVLSFSPHLPRDFVESHFDFFEKELSGTSEQRPRWKRCLQQLEMYMGDNLGRLYTKLYFPEESKAEALRIVECVRDALRERLKTVDWMSEPTRTEALKKMENFRVKIGYPDKSIDYTPLAIAPYKPSSSNHISNVISCRIFAFGLDLSRANRPTDRELWLMTPQTVNAYYHPSLNEIVFPAAILQHPFFDTKNDEAVNFGALGAVVGHEMTHGFDDQGRKYDSQGNMRDWWAGSDGEEYERRASVMIEQAETVVVHGVNLKGKLTCGENIADLGGVKLALRALKCVVGVDKVNTLSKDGFTVVQRFFLSWAQAWRQNIKKERALQLVTLDPHGPNEFRCNGTLSNIPEFLDAFGVTDGDLMYKPPSARVDIW